MPITIPDPGPDGVRGNGDDGPGIAGFNLNPANVSLPVLNYITNGRGTGEYKTVEFSANKRQSGRWSLSGAVSVRWNNDQENAYLGQNLRSQDTVVTANDLIHTDNGQHIFKLYTFKINGSYEAPWSIRLTPALRFQSGQPFGRTFLATSAYGINYGTQRILAESVGSQRQDHIGILDVRIEKYFRLGAARQLGTFVDVYNITNSDAAQNITWNSGSAYRLPTSVIGPTIVRFGVKLDW